MNETAPPHPASRESNTAPTPRGPVSFRLSLRVDSICGKVEADEAQPTAIPRPHITPPKSDPLAIARRVDQLCQQFEDEWRESKKPRIEDLLPGLGDDARAPVLRELVALEIELRQLDGDTPHPEEYLERFSADAESLSGLFEELKLDNDETAPIQRRDDSSPTRIGPYELLEVIGRGGMGVVYRARHVEVNRIVALKMIASGGFASEAEIVRFRGEAEAASNLEHPNIVPILDVNKHAGRPYYTMRLMTGGSLARRLKKSRIDATRAARIVATMARAMHHAHRRGLVHRDLKPANILFDEAGLPHVTDFGLAKQLGRNGPTGSGAPLGTPGYMAPEQAAGRNDITASADIYSLGAILYELLTGRQPFRASTVMETLVMIMEREPESPRKLNPTAPRALEHICLKCLEKDATWRYSSAAALADDLDRFLLGEEIDASPAGFLGGIRRKIRREPALTCRLLGLGLISFFTQSNFMGNPALDFNAHVRVTSVEMLWIFVTLVCHRLGKNPKCVERARPLWVIADLVCITAIFHLRNATASALILGYGLLIAISGLWARSKLVWMTTLISMSCYSLLAFDAWIHGRSSDPNHHPDMVLAILAVMGIVVVQQVKRIWALSSFFENRQNDESVD